MSELDRVMYNNTLTNPKFDDYKPIHRETKSSRYKNGRNNLDEHVNKVLNRSTQSDSDMEGQGIEKTIKPSNIIDFFIPDPKCY